MKTVRVPLASLTITLAIGLSACGSTSSPAASGSTPTPSSAALVVTATATVSGKSEVILTNAHGMTLYYFDPDSATHIACTGGCATTWPPLIATSDTVSGGAGMTGTLSVLDGPNGKQVLYNGHPLYTYAPDTAAGDTKGDGLFGKWHVATPTLGAAAAASSNTGGGYSKPSASGYTY